MYSLRKKIVTVFPWLRVLKQFKYYMQGISHENKKNFYRILGNLLTVYAHPGHYYSPIPSLQEVKNQEDKIWNFQKNLLAIDLNEQEQLNLLNQFQEYISEIPFNHSNPNLRYFFEASNSFPRTDGTVLYCMIRHLNPQKIIEVGSGYSSALMLDTNQLFFDNSISCTFIDPGPQRLLSLLKKSEVDKTNIMAKKVQEVDISLFLDLGPGDILFIDSSHISKIGSDVNYLIFEVLPRIAQGVYVHFHDICYPFEYPKQWIFEDGRAWNEAYLLRAFLQYNSAFEIIFFNHFLTHFHFDKIKKVMPSIQADTGQSIWLKKL